MFSGLIEGASSLSSASAIRSFSAVGQMFKATLENQCDKVYADHRKQEDRASATHAEACKAKEDRCEAACQAKIVLVDADCNAKTSLCDADCNAKWDLCVANCKATEEQLGRDTTDLRQLKDTLEAEVTSLRTAVKVESFIHKSLLDDVKARDDQLKELTRQAARAQASDPMQGIVAASEEQLRGTCEDLRQQLAILKAQRHESVPPVPASAAAEVVALTIRVDNVPSAAVCETTLAVDVAHQGALASKDAELERLQASLDLKDAELARLQAAQDVKDVDDVDDVKDAELARLRAAQDVKDVELAELRDVKDAEIARLRAALDVKGTELAAEAVRASELTAEAKRAAAEVSTKEDEIKRLTLAKEAEAAEATRITDRLRTQRNEYKAELDAELADKERVAPNGKRIKFQAGGSGRDLIRFPQ